MQNIKGKNIIAKNIKYDNIEAPEHFQSVPSPPGISNIDSAVSAFDFFYFNNYVCF